MSTVTAATMDDRAIPIPWSKAKDILHTGDILLCRKSSIMGEAISYVTGSDRVHAAMVGWVKDDNSTHLQLMMAETIQQYAARVIDLEGEIRRWPGYYDVYRPLAWSQVHGRWDAWLWIRRSSGSCYGWKYIWRIWLRRSGAKWTGRALFFLGRNRGRRWGKAIARAFIPAIPNSDIPGTNRDCSALIHATLRQGGGPQVEKHDCDVAPGDLTDRSKFEYIGTLVYDDPESPLQAA